MRRTQATPGAATQASPMTLSQARVLLGWTHAPRSGTQTSAITQQPHSRDVQVAIGTHTAEGLRAAAQNKRTGEWKVSATGGRRTDFAHGSGSATLFDHHRGPGGERLGRRKQESNFFITVNTNKRTFTSQDRAAVQAAVTRCFGERAYDILEFGPVHADYKIDKNHPQAVVEDIKTRATVEIGPQTLALHAHVWFRVTHWSQLRVDRRALQVMFKNAYNEHAATPISPKHLPAVQIQLLPQSDLGQIMAHYLSKQVGAVPGAH